MSFLILLATVVIVLVACGPAPTKDSNEAGATAVGTVQAVATTPTAPPAAPSSQGSTAQGDRLAEETARQLMYELIGDDESSFHDATEVILEGGDRRFVAVFLELMRAQTIGIVGGSFEKTVEALEILSGQEYGGDWPAWVEWYGASDLIPPPGFTGWKGTLLGRIDPGFADFLRDEHPSRIRVEEIQWGGVRVDGIPPLEQAPMIAGSDAEYLTPEEPVFGVEINGEARAYPLRIVDNHEMANDVVGGVPISLAYCTLCGAAIAYDGRAPNGETYTFGTSGFLYRSNKLMYDRSTRTLWNQLTGEPVLGPLAAQEDLRLDFFPVVLSAWKDWLAQHPDTLVLDRDTGIYRPEFYEPGVLYGEYFESSETMFPVWQRSDLLEDKAFVYTLYLDGVPKAYEVEALAEEHVVNDTVGQTPVVLVATRGTVTVNGFSRRVGPVTYTNGGEVRAYERGNSVFRPGPDPYTLVDSAGREWQVKEEGLLGPNGESAPRLSGHLAYWFGWYAFFPETLLYGGSE